MAVIFLRSLLPNDFNGSATMHSSQSEKLLEQGQSVSKKEDESTSPFRINPRIISDATIGLSDGLTVPFALTAGLSALGDTKVVIFGGFAELIAGGISMGLGGYLGARSEAEAYHTALSETRAIVHDDPQKARSMVRSTFKEYNNIDAATLDALSNDLLQSPAQTIKFIMRFYHQLAEADYAPARAYISGLTISAGYFFGGLMPLTPYLFTNSIHTAFQLSVLVMILALFVFGWVKTSLLGEKDRVLCIKNGVQMVVLGGVAALAAMGCVKAIG